MRIATTPIAAPRSDPPYLPLHAAGSDFSSTLSSAIRASMAGALKPPVVIPHFTGSRTLQQATFVPQPSGNPGYWGSLAQSIGANYLGQQGAAVFERQMALESGNFSPDVISGKRVSSAGAEGIAQLMPSSYPNVNRLDPIASLNAAGATMRENLSRYGGDMAKALAAYNAGAGRVDAAIAARGSAWQADLPAETQQYLHLILGSPGA